jgi:hypothetical protein
VIDGVGVGDGVGSAIQSNIASKSKFIQAAVVVVVVGHDPEKKISSHKSGQIEKHGDLPDSLGSPPKLSDKHHCLSVVL